METKNKRSKHNKTKTQKFMSAQGRTVFKGAVRAANRGGTRLGPRQMGLVRANEVELKGVDLDISFNPVVSTTTTNDCIVGINLMPQGAAPFNRIGRKINLKSIRVRGNIAVTCGVAANVPTNGSTFARVMIVWDRFPNGAALPVFDFLCQGVSQLGGALPGVDSSVNTSYAERFRILRDEMLELHPQSVPAIGIVGASTASTSRDMRTFDFFVPLSGMQTTFGSNVSPCTWTEVSSGGLLFVARLKDQLNITASALTASARVRYTDA